MIHSELKKIFLSLVQRGIDFQSVSSFKYDASSEVDWVKLKALADQHGLSAVVLDGLNEVRSKSSDVKGECFPSQQFTLQWIGEVMQNYEQRYVQYQKAIASLAGWYNQHGYKMMVLKGYSCSLDWSKPNHRPIIIES